MLIIDENLFRLTKMYESLLKVDKSNRIENLNKYKENAIKIDSMVFTTFLENISHINEHNHTLESELEFLESIKDEYKEISDLQTRFKNVCELYGDNIELSDLSQVKIDYIDERINAIKGYLINNKNIEKNKIEIQELNEQLISEEKKQKFLEDKIVELERTLKDTFVNTEGRLLVDGKLQYTSILTEYNKLGFDVCELLKNQQLLDQTLSEYNKKRSEFAESVKAAEVCYNSLLSNDSKQVLTEIKKEYLLIKYKVTMLKIVKKVSIICNDYEQFVVKREQLIDLIKFRLDCLNELNIKMSIDPFSRIKIQEQLDIVSSFSNNSKTISRLMKQISELNSRIEEMVDTNKKYLNSLTVTDSLLESMVSFSDIDISVDDDFNFEDMLTKKQIADNQVINIREFSSKFNINVVKQKTSSVIKRVSQMLTKKKGQSKSKANDSHVPELVIVPKKEERKEILDNPISFEETILPIYDGENVEFEEVSDIIQEERNSSISDVIDISGINDSMFETIVPFEGPSFFESKIDEDIFSTSINPFDNKNEEKDGLTEESIFETVQENTANIGNFQSQEQMPDVFWEVPDDVKKEENVIQFVPSFDDQINKLLATEEDVKSRRKIA